MSLRIHYLRAEKYLRRKGLVPALHRAWREVKNLASRRQIILFMRDLHDGDFGGPEIPDGCRIERYAQRSEIPARLYEGITEHYSEALLVKNIRKRFEHGASLWCLRSDREDIGYMWTVTIRAMQAFCLPPMGRDVYIMDSFVFPAHRGSGMSSVLRNHILRYHKSEGFCRAYCEAWEWNEPVLRALAKNGFVRLGRASKAGRRGKPRWTFRY